MTIFRELRDGKTMDGKSKLKQPSSTLSPAGGHQRHHERHRARHALRKWKAAGLRRGQRHARRDGSGYPVQDRIVMQDNLETVIKERDGWKDLYRACKDVL